jgi:DNA primase large subunit
MGILNKILTTKKKIEVMSILEDPHATHYQRVWMVGFLKYGCGYTNQQVFDIINRFNRWTDYNPNITRYQIESVKKQRGRINLLD